MKIFAAIALVLVGCGGGDEVITVIGSCEDHPLATGIVAKQTGISVDSFD